MTSFPSSAATTWSPPEGPLGALTAQAYVRAKALMPQRDALERLAHDVPAPVSFAAALRQPTVAVIAEVKRRSPSRGDINPSMQTSVQSLAYVRGGAAALSILTEPDRFGGSPEDLAEAHRAVSLPLLRKDFIVDPVQIIEARTLGAAAVLLIARALPIAQLRELAATARDFQLEALIEVRDLAELASALDVGARVVGVNHRNLETLVIDPDTTRRVFPHVPPHVTAVAESGVAGRGDVERVAAIGADAVLVGSSVSGSPDPENAVRMLTGVSRHARS